MTTPVAEPVVAPQPEQNQADAVGKRSAKQLAQNIVEMHKAGIAAQRQALLLCEKLLLHVDGTADLQWADIYRGVRVEIPREVSEFRKSENLLRLVVDNAVAHHTTAPLRYFADSLPDRRARDRALIDALWMNYLVAVQDLNGLFADALYMAMPAGFAPVHVYWRDDNLDQYEPITPTGEGSDPAAMMQRIFNPKPGMADCWLGNPFDHVFDPSAKRGSIHWQSYGRVLPANLVRRTFAHMPGVEGLEGSTRLPSAANFQRIAKSWSRPGLGLHGTPVMEYRRHIKSDEEMVTVVSREILPGYETDYPEGRLQIVAVPGEVDFREGKGNSGNAILLADQPLPAQDFSCSIFYSHQRSEDVRGKPWVEDIDQRQVDLNIALSKRWELTEKMVDAPIVAPAGAISDDMAFIENLGIIELEPSLAGWRPRVMEWSPTALTALDNQIKELRQSIYTGGGYQAVSRGEAPGSRMAAQAIVALQAADSSIHGPVNQRFKRSACDFAVRCWKQMKAYGDVPWLIEIVGDEYAYLAEPYINNAKMSERPPRFRLVNAFGISPEDTANELMQLVQRRGADGQPILTTDEFRRHYPHTQLFESPGNPKVVAQRRAKTVATACTTLAEQFRQQTGFTDDNPASPQVQQAGIRVFQMLESKYPRLRDDDLMAHIAALTEITQDETADPIARFAAVQRQNLYFAWQSMMAGQAPPTNAAPSPSPRPATAQSQPASAAQAAPGGM